IAKRQVVVDHPQHVFVAEQRPLQKIAVGHRALLAHLVVHRALIVQRFGGPGIPVRFRFLHYSSRPFSVWAWSPGLSPQRPIGAANYVPQRRRSVIAPSRGLDQTLLIVAIQAATDACQAMRSLRRVSSLGCRRPQGSARSSNFPVQLPQSGYQFLTLFVIEIVLVRDLHAAAA